MAKRLLIFHTTGGMGHIQAAKAIEQAVAIKYPGLEVKNVNLIDYAARAYQKVFDDGYGYLVTKHPKLWGWFYKRMDEEANRKLPILLSKMAIENKFLKLLEDYKPDFIIATHPLPIWLITASKRQDLLAIKSALVITDFYCHRVWLDPAVNYYFVGSEQVAQLLKDYQIEPSKIVVSGIPILPKFAVPLQRSAIVEKLGLRADQLTFLIIGGLMNFKTIKKVVLGLKSKNPNLQFIIVARQDENLKKDLMASGLNHDESIKIFGFVENMEELMTVADLIFTKAGGLTVAECLAKSLPMVFNKVIPGQEEGNVRYLIGQGAAIWADNLKQVILMVNKILAQPEKLVVMKSVCQKLSRPTAAADLADFVYQVMNN